MDRVRTAPTLRTVVPAQPCQQGNHRTARQGEGARWGPRPSLTGHIVLHPLEPLRQASCHERGTCLDLCVLSLLGALRLRAQLWEILHGLPARPWRGDQAWEGILGP